MWASAIRLPGDDRIPCETRHRFNQRESRCADKNPTFGVRNRAIAERDHNSGFRILTSGRPTQIAICSAIPRNERILFVGRRSILRSEGEHLLTAAKIVKHSGRKNVQISRNCTFGCDDDGFFAPAALSAQEDIQKLWEGSGYAHPGKGMRTMKMMHMMDTNKDGKVTKEESMAYHEKVWMMMDKNGKGYLMEEDWITTELKKQGG